MSHKSANVVEAPFKTSREDVEQKVRELIIAVHKLVLKPAELTDDMCQLEVVRTVELALQLEGSFGILLDDADLNAENFKRVSNIVNLVLSKMEE